MRRAAGIAFVRPGDGTTLLTKRAMWLDAHPGTWAHVGGGIEEGESPFEAACREAEEELGLPRGYVRQHGTNLGALSNNSFVLFVVTVGPRALQRVTLNEENTAAMWMPLVSPREFRKFLPAGDRMHPTTKLWWRSITEMSMGEAYARRLWR